jgi:small conductance mechanosensitive channel
MNLTQEEITTLVIVWGKNILLAIVIFLLGKWIAAKVTNLAKAGMKKREVDPALVSFLTSIAYYALMVAVVIAAIGQLGIKTTSFVAVLGAAGLAVGLALQGSLSNFAAGTLIILFRPFRIGDFVEAGGTAGIIEEIGVLFTQMKSPDNKKIIVPNSQIMGGTITNITANPIRRIDLEIGVAYTDDIDKAKEIIMDELVKNPGVLQDPAPVVELWSLGDSSVNFIVRPWANASDWFRTRCDLLPAIKKRIEAEGLSIPFPQRDVHLFQEK